MELKNGILKLVKEMPLLMSELEKNLELPMLDVIDAVKFLKKYELITTTPTDKGGGLVQITPMGLQLLNLPDLPEKESPSNLLEVMEQHWGDEIDRELDREADLNLDDKMIDLYTPDQQVESIKGITGMATRVGIRNSDVIHATWAIAKDTVGAKLERDVKGLKKRRKHRKGELSKIKFSEATIKSIKSQEDKRQKEIAEAPK